MNPKLHASSGRKGLTKCGPSMFIIGTGIIKFNVAGYMLRALYNEAGIYK